MANATDYYWTGGGSTRNWNDLDNWSLSSGGNVAPGQIPTALDDVYFHAGSFSTSNDTVDINVNNAVCHSMDWTGALNSPILIGPSISNLKIFGSLTLIPNMNYAYYGTINFESAASNNFIKSCGKIFLNKTTFDGVGSWTLLDAFSSTSSLNMNFGCLNTNNQSVTAASFCSTSPTIRSLILGSSVMIITGGGVTAFAVNYTNFVTVRLVLNFQMLITTDG